MKTESKKLKGRTYSNIDWDKIISQALDTVSDVFGNSGKLGGSTTTTDTTTSPTTDTKSSTEKDTTLYWIIGGAAFALIVLVAVIALKK